MTSAAPLPPDTSSAGAEDPPERHRAPALWIVVAGLLVTVAVAVLEGAAAASTTLSAVLVGAAVARLIGRGRRPEGIAVRSTWVDVLFLLVLAVGVGVLQLAPGVR